MIERLLHLEIAQPSDRRGIALIGRSDHWPPDLVESQIPGRDQCCWEHQVSWDSKSGQRFKKKIARQLRARGTSRYA